MLVKQSTAATIIVGPCLDSAGAEYTGLVIGDLSISKLDAGTLTAMAAAATLTSRGNGYYGLVMTTGNTDTLGRCQIVCTKSTYQMPKAEFMVLPATVYDAIVTNAVNATGGLTGATGAITGFAGVIATTTNITAGTITTTTNLTNLPAITAGWLTATGIADNAITAAKIADSAIDTATFATGATIPRVTLADTLTTYTGNTPQTADHTAAIATIDGIVDTIKLNTDYPDDCVYLDTTDGTAGTVVGVNGTIRLPAFTFAEAATIAAARLNKRIRFVNDTGVLLESGTFNSYSIDLNGGSISINNAVMFNVSRFYSSSAGPGRMNPDTLNGQTAVNINQAMFCENIRFGFSVNVVDYCYLKNCVIGANVNPQTFTILGDNGADPVVLENCYTEKVSGLTFDVAGGADLILNGWYGDFTITNLAAGTTVQVYGYAKVTLAASCTGGTIRYDSHVEVTDQSGGLVTQDLISEATPWNPAWDAEVQSECTDALTAFGAATVANQTVMIDGIGFLTAHQMGACADAGTSAETFVITFGGATYTLDFTGLDSTGNRTGVTRTKT